MQRTSLNHRPGVYAIPVLKGAGGGGGGAAVAPSSVTFRAFDGDSGVANLPQAITANSATVSPSLRYEGSAATLSAWPSVVGGALAIASTGTAPTVAQDTPFTGADAFVQFQAGQVYQAGDTTTGDVGLEDMVGECIFFYTPGASSSRALVSKKGTTGAGWALRIGAATGRIDFTVIDAAAATSTQTLASNAAVGWNHLMWMVDRDQAGGTNGCQIFLNGVASAPLSTFAPTTVAGSWTNAKSLTIGADSDLAAKTNAGVAFVSTWQLLNWFSGTNAATWSAMANDRFSRVAGIMPSRALGTAAPLLSTRSSTATLEKANGSAVTSWFTVGTNWTRFGSRIPSSGSTPFKGALIEPARTNLVLQSAALDDVAWTKTAATVTPNTGAMPDGTLTADAIVADATAAQHSVSQAVTLTAANYVLSGVVKRGAVDFVILENATIASGQVWFNLNAGTVGTTQAGILEAIIENLGTGLFRVSARFLGTAAAHTLKISPASADNVVAFTGDALSTSCTVSAVQCELGDLRTTYIATTTATVTRSTDALTYVANDGNMPASVPGTLSMDVLLPNTDITGPAFLGGGSASNGTVTTNAVVIGVGANDGITARMEAAAVTQYNINGAAFDVANNAIHSLKTTWDVNSGKAFVDGTQEGSTDVTVALYTTSPVLIYVGAGQLMALVANLQINNAVV